MRNVANTEKSPECACLAQRLRTRLSHAIAAHPLASLPVRPICITLTHTRHDRVCSKRAHARRLIGYLRFALGRRQRCPGGGALSYVSGGSQMRSGPLQDLPPRLLVGSVFVLLAVVVVRRIRCGQRVALTSRCLGGRVVLEFRGPLGARHARRRGRGGRRRRGG
jgi:hypothetical protein